MLTALIVVALTALVVYTWRHLRRINRFWAEKGVPHKTPHLFFGNTLSIFLKKRGLADLHREMSREFPNDAYYGFYDFVKPALVIRDVALVEQIMVKDFHHFMDHGLVEDDSNPVPADINLFNLNGKKWRATRNKFSPMFTTGKLRYMVPHIRELSENLTSVIGNTTTEGVELRDFLQRFAMDVIGTCAFGLTVNAIEKEEGDIFCKMGKMAFKMTPLMFLRIIIVLSFPKLARKFGITQNNPTSIKYFANVVRETLAYRKKTGKTRLDFVQLMVTLQQKGVIEFEGDENDDYLRTGDDENKLERYELTDEAMVGHALIFLIAGFKTTSAGLTFLFYELANHPEIQKKVREEIRDKVASKGGVIDYDTIKDMQYLSQCIKESLRLHSPLPLLFRVCTKEYTIPGTSLTLKPGQSVYIPVDAIHQNPDLYPEPEKFDPDRFAPDVWRPNCSHLPFGGGPRVCIAMRFALTEMKLCAMRLLLDYEFKLNSKTKVPLELDPFSFLSVPKHPVYFDIIKNKAS